MLYSGEEVLDSFIPKYIRSKVEIGQWLKKMQTEMRKIKKCALPYYLLKRQLNVGLLLLASDCCRGQVTSVSVWWITAQVKRRKRKIIDRIMSQKISEILWSFISDVVHSELKCFECLWVSAKIEMIEYENIIYRIISKYIGQIFDFLFTNIIATQI